MNLINYQFMIENPPPVRPISIIIMQTNTAEHTLGRCQLDLQQTLRLNNIINFNIVAVLLALYNWHDSLLLIALSFIVNGH